MDYLLNPYISFNGKTREAMDFYKSVFGGELTISTFADQGVTDAPADGIMHAQLAIDGKALIMGSDGMDESAISGISLALGGTNSDELRDYFHKLSEDGTVTKPLEKEAWGAEFGMVQDKFGINWMVNIDQAE